MAGRDSFIFYRSFYEAINELPKENQADTYKAIIEYALNQKEIELLGVSKAIFSLVKPQLDANYKKYENGKQSKSKIEANNKQIKSKTGTNVNDNVNDNDNENKNVNVNEVEILETWETQFEEFYKAYPRKVKRQDVKKWFKKNKPSNELFSSMLSSLEQFRASKDWQKDGGQFIPYPTTWLNQKRWEDEDISEKGQEETHQQMKDRFMKEIENE